MSDALSAEPRPQPVGPTGLGCLAVVARHHGMHLTVPQLIRDNYLGTDEPTVSQLLKCVTGAGLKAKVVHLKWSGLHHLAKVVPAIVRLNNGTSFVLRRIEGKPDEARVVLQDPNADDDALLVIDRIRFEEIWTGEAILVKRNYDIADEERPFSIGLVTALMFRERWIVRDVAICAVVLGFLALSPIIFWRLLSDKVIYYKAYNTFYVLCVVMGLDRVRSGIRLRAALAGPSPDDANRRQARDLHVREGFEPADGVLRTNARSA